METGFSWLECWIEGVVKSHVLSRERESSSVGGGQVALGRVFGVGVGEGCADLHARLLGERADCGKTLWNAAQIATHLAASGKPASVTAAREHAETNAERARTEPF